MYTYTKYFQTRTNHFSCYYYLELKIFFARTSYEMAGKPIIKTNVQLWKKCFEKKVTIKIYMFCNIVMMVVHHTTMQMILRQGYTNSILVMTRILSSLSTTHMHCDFSTSWKTRTNKKKLRKFSYYRLGPGVL